LFTGKAYYDTNSIEIRHYQIQSSNMATQQHSSTLVEALDGLKVAHLTDLHMKSIGVKENKILEILKEEKPDLILITGDFISFEGPYEPVMSFFHQIKAPFGVYGVLGNTEYSNENGSCILCHKEKSQSLKEKQNPVILRNSVVPLKINGGVVNIFGVDDPVDKKNDLGSSRSGMNPHAPVILLAHSPEIFEEASDSGIDLILCGHTHGGQIFITRYLRKIFPIVDPALEFLDGFFQKGKTLMYVSRGLGNSFLPFRLGVKPEITFFTFSNNTNNEKTRITRIDQENQITQLKQSDRTDAVSISNNSSKTIFTGLSLSSFIETFNILNIFDSLHLTAIQRQCNTSARQGQNTAAPQHRSTALQNILFDFEFESDLNNLNWECGKWFERSKANVTSGKHSLRAVLPPGQYPGIAFQEVRENWSGYDHWGMDVYNPSVESVILHIRIDDHKSGWEYADRFDTNFRLEPGMNKLMIPTGSIRTNVHHEPLNLKKIKRFMVFVPNNNKKRELYLDNIRLE